MVAVAVAVVGNNSFEEGFELTFDRSRSHSTPLGYSYGEYSFDKNANYLKC